MRGNITLSVSEVPPHIICYPRPTPECVGRRVNLLREAGVRTVVSEGRYSIKGFKVLGRGHAAVVLKAVLKAGEAVAVKILRTDSKRDSLLTECKLMSRAWPVAPAVIRCFDDLIVMELIEGVELGEAVDHILGRRSCLNVPYLIAKVLGAARYLDLKKVDHRELSLPRKHVILCRDAVRIIDYESAMLKERPSNVCRLTSWLMMRAGLWRECCGDPRAALEVLRPALRRYRRLCGDEEFKNIISLMIKLCRAHNEPGS